MGARPVRYRSGDEDSARWLDFEHRSGDIVVSSRSKSGTTWVQMICALLVFRSAELPRPLPELSPWLDWLVTPQAEVFAALAAQKHRRFIKTHTPLDGLPLDRRVEYVVIARHPLDAAVSLYHQSHNIDRRRLAELTGDPLPAESKVLPPLDVWLRSWILSDASPADDLDSVNGFLHHLADAWSRRDEPNVLLVHYQDLCGDLPEEMRRIAAGLDIGIGAELISGLAPAATFGSMRVNAENLAPDPVGVQRDKQRFFRTGRSGEGTALLEPGDLVAYESRAAALAPADLLRWLHRT